MVQADDLQDVADGPDRAAVPVRAGQRAWRWVVVISAAALLVASVQAEAPPSASTADRLVGGLFGLVFGAPLFVWLGVARSRLARPVGAGMAAAMLAVYGLSRWQPGSLPPPQFDWLIVFVALAAPACAVGLWMDRRHLRRAAAPKRRHAYTIASVALLVGALCAGCTFAAVLAERYKSGLASLSVDPTPGELGRLPAGLTVAAADPDCGSAGYCSYLLTVVGGLGQHRDRVAALLVEHLLAQGWRATTDAYDGSIEYTKPVGGILDWHYHEVRVDTDPDTGRRGSPPFPTDAVYVRLSSWTPIEGG
jgi:hypothetical protein